MLAIKNISKTFDKVEVLKNIDLEIADGEFVVLLGPSGSGKTTLMRIISGLETAEGGSIVFDDSVISDLAPKDRDLSMVFQNYALYPHMSVADNIGFPLTLSDVGKQNREQAVTIVAKKFEIQDLLKRKPRELSGGQRQRVALARAVIKNPKIFLMDEPLSNLDAKLRVQLRQEIFKLKQNSSSIFVYVTHDQLEALTLGDRIVILHEGRIQQAGTPLEIYKNPANIFVASFIGSPGMNILSSVAGYEDRLLGIRPEHFSLNRNSDTALNLKLELLNIENLGSEMMFYLNPQAMMQPGKFVVAKFAHDESIEKIYKEYSKNKLEHGPIELDLYVEREQLYYFDSQTGYNVSQ